MPEFICPICDRAAVRLGAHAIGCESFTDGDGCDSVYVAEFLTLLGLSIRRFVRRAEVEGLVAAVRHETLRHDYHCNNRRSGCGCRGDRAQSALDRLAAMAMEAER